MSNIFELFLMINYDKTKTSKVGYSSVLVVKLRCVR